MVTVADKQTTSPSALEASDPRITTEDVGLLDHTDLVVVSPGIPDSNPILRSARTRVIPVTNSTRIFFRYCPCPIVGVTGSSGKSTTTSLISAILKTKGQAVSTGGNIGTPMLDLLTDLSANSIAVVELSSFQLELGGVAPHVAVVTNISPNHLDRHGSIDAYIAAKRNIVTDQSGSDMAVLNGGDGTVREFAEGTQSEIFWFGMHRPTGPGTFVDGDWIVVDTGSGENRVVRLDELQLPGWHNVENTLAAVAATHALGVDPSTMREGIVGFHGLPHRLDTIRVRDGITFVDDSIATTPERAAVGIRALSGPLVLIAGGRSKHLPWTHVVEAAQDKVRAAVLIGEAANEIESAIRSSFRSNEVFTVHAEDMAQAVEVARSLALHGDTVLLSPGCTSFDMFKDFEERGLAFASLVEEQIDGSND